MRLLVWCKLLALSLTYAELGGYSLICVKIPQFSLPWQQGSVLASWVNFSDIVKLRNPSVNCNILGLISTARASDSISRP